MSLCNLTINTAANLILLKSDSDYVTPLLKKVPSFPISFRVKTKVLTSTYKSLHDVGPLLSPVSYPATLFLINSTPATLTSLMYPAEDKLGYFSLKATALAYSCLECLSPPTSWLAPSSRSFFKSPLGEIFLGHFHLNFQTFPRHFIALFPALFFSLAFIS